MDSVGADDNEEAELVGVPECWSIGLIRSITPPLQYSILRPLHHSIFHFFALGPNGSGWNGASRSRRNASKPPFFFASSKRLLNSSRLLKRAMAASSALRVHALRRPIISR